MRKFLVLCVVLVAACQSPTPPQDTPSASNAPAVSTVPPNIQRLTPPEPSCYGTPYAEKKVSYDGRHAIPGRTADNVPRFQPQPRWPAERILVQANRLPTPPEIAAIERGYTYHWVGGFINDGLATWHGIDLDRRRSIHVQRRIWDARAQLSRRFSDPVFSEHDPTSFARKWSSEQRVETEVVQITNLEHDDIMVFVCVANGAWSLPPPAPGTIFMPMSDTMVNDAILHDRQIEQGEGIQYRKTMKLMKPVFSMNSSGNSPLPYKWDIEPHGGRQPRN